MTKEIERLTEEWKIRWLRLETEILLRELSSCNKTAILVPNYKSEKYKRILGRGGKQSEVFVGEEMYTSVHTVVDNWCNDPTSCHKKNQRNWSVRDLGLLE